MSSQILWYTKKQKKTIACLCDIYTKSSCLLIECANILLRGMAWNPDYLSAEEYQRVVDIKPISGEQPKAATGRALKFGEWVALLSICAADEGPAGVRDAGMIALFKG